MVRLKTTFRLPDTPHQMIPWGVRLQDLDFERINLYLNGVLIGRYWKDCRCQDIFYLPDSLLERAPDRLNTLELILVNFSPPIGRKQLNLQAHHVSMTPYEAYRVVPARMEGI